MDWDRYYLGPGPSPWPRHEKKGWGDRLLDITEPLFVPLLVLGLVAPAGWVLYEDVYVPFEQKMLRAQLRERMTYEWQATERIRIQRSAVRLQKAWQRPWTCSMDDRVRHGEELGHHMGDTNFHNRRVRTYNVMIQHTAGGFQYKEALQQSLLPELRPCALTLNIPL